MMQTQRSQSTLSDGTQTHIRGYLFGRGSETEAEPHFDLLQFMQMRTDIMGKQSQKAILYLSTIHEVMGSTVARDVALGLMRLWISRARGGRKEAVAVLLGSVSTESMTIRGGGTLIPEEWQEKKEKRGIFR